MNSFRKIVRTTLKEDYYTTWKSIEEGRPVDQFKGQETEILNKLTKHLGISKVAPLGQGTGGFAYYIPNNRVLKITKDKTEAAEAFKIKGKKLKHLANVYDVYALHGKYEGTYVIISELLDKDEKIDIGYDLLFDFAREVFSESSGDGLLINYWDGTMQKKDLPGVINHIYDWVEEQQLDSNKVDALLWYFKGMIGIIDDLDKYAIQSRDWGVSNLGIKRNGNLAMYDLGYGDENLSPKIQNINLNQETKS